LNLSFYIARRYFFGKKSHNLINWISGISVVGVFFGTMSLIIVLSVFNGFDGVVKSFYNKFDPDLKLTPVKGKFFSADSIKLEKIQEISGVETVVQVLEDNALVKYHDNQQIAVVKGVSSNFIKNSALRTALTEGVFVLEDSLMDYGLFGAGVAYYLSLSLQDAITPVEIFLPDQENGFSLNPAEAFSSGRIFAAGVFSTQQEFDLRYVIVPLRLMQQLSGGQKRITSVEVLIKAGSDIKYIQQKVELVAGERFEVKNRYQQQEVLYNIMKSEKWAVFTILTFILLIATLTIVGALSMLIIEKKKDIAILAGMGAHTGLIRRIFLTEGMMICLTGAVSGLLTGAFVCWLQQTFGLIKINTTGSTFAIESYPVAMQWTDFALVFSAITIIGFCASLIPAMRISRSPFFAQPGTEK
jgi:lipoprotein-releasing system permease protein